MTAELAGAGLAGLAEVAGAVPVGLAGVQPVRRAVAALEFLAAAAPHPVRVGDVARHLEVAPATASRMLASLVGRGYAGRTADRRFTVGPRSVPLATAWIRRLQACVAGPIGRVGAATGELVLVSQLLGDAEVPVAWRWPSGVSPGPAGGLSGAPVDGLADALAAVAEPWPLWATASGRALLSGVPPAHRPRILPPEPYPRLTGLTRTHWSDVRSAIRAGAQAGLHEDGGEVSPDLWCCAVALEPAGPGEVLAMSVVCHREPAARQRARIHRALRREAHAMNASLAVPS